MALNTPYLSPDVSAQSNLNTPYLQTGVVGFNSDISSTGTLFLGGQIRSASAASFGALTGSTLTLSGLATLSASSMRGLADFQSTRTQAGLLSFATTASAASTILPDGAFGIYFQSVTSCRLCYRSGNTTYTWIATTGAVL